MVSSGLLLTHTLDSLESCFIVGSKDIYIQPTMGRSHVQFIRIS